MRQTANGTIFFSRSVRCVGPAAQGVSGQTVEQQITIAMQ